MPLWSVIVPALVLVMLLVVTGQQPDGRLHLWVLDVGQGEAILVKTPGGRTAVIDGGPAGTPLLSAVGSRLPFWQRNLDLVVLTQPSQDRLMGLVDLLGHYDVEQVVQREFTPTGAVEEQWQSLLRSSGAPVHRAQWGDKLTFEGEANVTLEVLYVGEVQDEPMSLRLTYGPHSILIGGDVRAEAEARMVGYWGDKLRSLALVVGRYGSKDATSDRLLQAAQPRVAAISVGADNRFDYPAPETLERLAAAGATVYRTDLNGSVEIVMDRERLWVKTER